MKTKLLVLVMWCFAVTAFAQQLDYKGVGILKVKKGDVVTILPEKAFVINTDIYDLGVSALEYVESNQSDSIILVLNERIEIYEQSYTDAMTALDGCIQDNKKVLGEALTHIDELNKTTEEQRNQIKKLEYQAREEKLVLKKQQQKSRIRTALLVPIAAIVAWVGFEYFK